mmetsp:Transcript_8638/g.25924  ORF Transcript_8638/g.25924 Transcript_8638/m.25924 type:complete len:109 (+) Transcript_8638:1013-1339(+)
MAADGNASGIFHLSPLSPLNSSDDLLISSAPIKDGHMQLLLRLPRYQLRRVRHAEKYPTWSIDGKGDLTFNLAFRSFPLPSLAAENGNDELHRVDGIDVTEAKNLRME